MLLSNFLVRNTGNSIKTKKVQSINYNVQEKKKKKKTTTINIHVSVSLDIRKKTKHTNAD